MAAKKKPAKQKIAPEPKSPKLTTKKDGAITVQDSAGHQPGDVVTLSVEDRKGDVTAKVTLPGNDVRFIKTSRSGGTAKVAVLIDGRGETKVEFLEDGKVFATTTVE